jgi:hypothetical protein
MEPRDGTQQTVSRLFGVKFGDDGNTKIGNGDVSCK